MIRRASFVLALVGAGALSACGASSSAGLPSSTGAPATAPITSTLIGPLQYIGQTAVLQITQPGYLGPFTITSSDGSVLSLAQKLTATQRGPASGGPQTIISPNGQAFVTALSQGSASLSINGFGGVSVSPSNLQSIAIGGGAPGSLVAAPNAFAFTAVGQTGSFTLTETGFPGPWTVSSSSSAVATVTPASGAGPFTVTAVAAGAATLTISDGQVNTITVPVGVTTTSGAIQ